MAPKIVGKTTFRVFFPPLNLLKKTNKQGEREGREKRRKEGRRERGRDEGEGKKDI